MLRVSPREADMANRIRILSIEPTGEYDSAKSTYCFILLPSAQVRPWSSYVLGVDVSLTQKDIRGRRIGLP
jgi:hypothetical protein